MARPIKEESEKLTKRVGFRVTENAHAAYMMKLQKGITPSEWFRDAVMNDETQVIVRTASTEESRAIIVALAHIGNNINQLARATNSAFLSGMLGDEVASKILVILTNINDNAKQAAENAY